MARSVIHLNIADFAAAVETSLQPGLKGYPLIIAPSGAPRAMVYDMNEHAFRQGIKKGMPLARAKQINKKIKLLPPRFNRYEQVMKALLKKTLIFTPHIEAGAIDGHIFMDVTGSGRLFGSPADIAFKLKKCFQKNFHLDPAWSVATNKLVAKVATRIVKPAGEYIVTPGEEKTFLLPLPIQVIPGLVTADINRLKTFNLVKVSQARTLTLAELEIIFPKKASLIYDLIRGMDSTPVTCLCQNMSSLQADHEFADDTNQKAILKKGLYLMIEKVCKMMRNKNRHTGVTKLILSYADGLQTTARLKLNPHTSNDIILFKKCIPLLNRAWSRRVRVRHMRLICEKLSLPRIQEELFVSTTESSRHAGLVSVMDQIRTRFGSQAVRPALTLVDKT